VDSLGLLAYLLPELEPARGAEQPKEHYWDVLGHSLAAVEYLDVLLSEAEPEAMPGRVLWQALWSELAWWQEGADYFREEVVPWMSRAALLKLGGLLHDVGKPATRSTDETGRMRFFGHQHVGADIAAAALRRLRFSSREVAMVRAMVAAHLRPVQMAQQGPPTRRAIYRFFRDTGEAGIETLFLSLADHLATVGPRLNEAGWRRHVALTSYILEKRLREADVVAPPKLLKGEEVMAALGLPPGPLVGQLLEAVREAQAAGEISTREEALALARRLAAGARAIEDPGRRT
jgi:poly(A) polymerase